GFGLAFEDSRPANDASRTLVRSLECAAVEGLGLAPRFALLALCAPAAKFVGELSERLRAPAECRDLALLAHRPAEALARGPGSSAAELLALLERCDAFRRPERFRELLALVACAERGARGWARVPFPPAAALRGALRAAAGVDAG